MNNKVILIILTSIIGIFTVIIIGENRIKKSEYHIKSLRADLIKLDTIYHSFTKAINDCIVYDGFPVSDIDLVNAAGKTLKLKDIVESEKLVIYLPNISCNTCTIGEIEIIESVFSEQQKKNIILISNFTNNREIKIFEKESSIKTFGVFKSKDFPNSELTNKIVLFMVSDLLQGQCVFLPQIDNSKLSELYYKVILERMIYKDKEIANAANKK